MTNCFILDRMFGLRVSTSCVLQWILLITWTLSLLQTLVAGLPSMRLEGNISIGIADGATGDKPSRVLKVCVKDNGLQRFGRLVPQLIRMLEQNSLQCNITVLKNATFSRRLLINHQLSILAIEEPSCIKKDSGGYMPVGKGFGLSKSESFVTNALFFCHYKRVTGDVQKCNCINLSYSSLKCSIKATAGLVVVANTSGLIDLELCVHNHSAYTRLCLMSQYFLHVNFKHEAMNISWIESCAILLRIALLVPTCISDRLNLRLSTVNLPEWELPIIYHYSPSQETGALLVGLNFSETKPTSAKNFTFDNHKWARWIFLAITIFLQFFVPVFHLLTYTGSDRSFRIVSFYAFLSFFAWLSFYTCCTMWMCYEYGQVMQDLSLFCNIMLPMCYLILIGESCVSTELLSITNTLEDRSMAEYIESLRKALPGRYCTVKCYNYGLFHKRVLCFKESKLFSIEHSVDLSDDPPLDTVGITRMRLSMDIDFGDEETAEKYREVEIEALQTNYHKGSHVSVTHHDFIPGFHDIICGYSDRGQRPFWMNPSFYVLISIFGLSWPYRYEPITFFIVLPSLYSMTLSTNLDNRHNKHKMAFTDSLAKSLLSLH